MGLFNRLITKIKCSNCHYEFETAIQYKFGETRQHNARIGEEIRWGVNDVGEPGNAIVMVYGITESAVCAKCDFQNKEEFDILVENNILSKVSEMADSQKYTHSYDGNWYILKA